MMKLQDSSTDFTLFADGKIDIWITFNSSSAHGLNLDWSQILSFGKELTFNRKILTFNDVFYTAKENFQYLGHTYFLVCKCFQFG